MYIGDHIVFNSMVAILVSRRWSLPLVPLVSLFIFINCMDYDHLLNFRLDDGTADSLILHPLHRMGGFIIFIVAAFSLIFPQYKTWLFSVIIAFSAHLFCDQLANFVHYQLSGLIAFAILQTALFLYVAILYVSTGPLVGFISYILVSWAVATFQIMFTNFGLHMNPLTDVWVWIIPSSLAVLCAILFWMIFSTTQLDARVEAN